MYLLLLLLLAVAANVAQLARSALTEEQKHGIVQVYNLARATTSLPASNMRAVRWDDALAEAMQKYTDTCEFHLKPEAYTRPPRGSIYLYRDQGYDPVGVARWRSTRMAPYYDYATRGCANNTAEAIRICRHPELYAKIVIAENTRVGCGMTICGEGPKGVIHACASYLEASTGAYPFEIGARCTQCGANAKYCLNAGLCSEQSSAPTMRTMRPSLKPTMRTMRPSLKPTRFPTRFPTRRPTTQRPTKRIPG